MLDLLEPGFSVGPSLSFNSDILSDRALMDF